MTGRGRLLKARLRQRVIVTLKSGEAFTGTLWDADGKVVVLKNAVFHDTATGGDPTAVDGEIVVHTADVSYLQIL